MGIVPDHQRNQRLATEIIEEVYVNEVMEALEYCFGVFESLQPNP